MPRLFHVNNKQLWFLGLLLLVSFCLTLFRLGKGSKPAGRQDNTPSKGDRYQVFMYAPPQGSTRLFPAGTINIHGAMVGGAIQDKIPNSWRGFLFDPAIDPAGAFHLDDLVHIPKGWCIRYAYGINDHGALVASMGKIDQEFPHGDALEIRGIVVDTREERTGGKWRYHPVPRNDARISLARSIDNRGEVNGFCTQDESVGRGQMLIKFTYNMGLYRKEGPDPKPVFFPSRLHWTSFHPKEQALEWQAQMGGGLFGGAGFSFKRKPTDLEKLLSLFSW